MAALAAPATAELPLYLQMSRYIRGSKAVMELRTERFLAEQNAQAEGQAPEIAKIAGIDETSDDQLITGSIGDTTDADGFSFNDLLDTINPLQHLPIISTLYRDLTGDEIKPAARIVGGALFGGPIGAGIAITDAVLEQASGTDSGGHIMSLLSGEPSALTPGPEDFPNFSLPNPGLPNLSAEAFNSLLTVAPQDAGSGLALRGSLSPLASPNDIPTTMGSALDMYNALKQEQRR